MEYVIKGRIRDSEGKALSGISVNGFDKDLISSDLLGSSKTDNDGHFEIPFNTSDFDRFHVEGEPEVYLKIVDPKKSFKAVKDKQGSYTRDKKSGDWNSNIIDSINDIDKYDITIVIQPRKIPIKYESVVIGSGFGGTITSLTVANMYTKNPSGKNNNDGLEIYVPLFNIYPGHNQTQNIEITSNRSEKITISNIVFKAPSSGLSFKVNDPIHRDKQAQYPLQLDLLPNTKIGVPLTINADANQQLENIDFDFEVDVLSVCQQNPATTITLTIKSHIGHKRICLLERGQWWVSHEMPASSDGIVGANPSPTIRQYLETNNIPYNTWAYPDNTKGLLRLFGTIRIFDNIRGLYDYRPMQNVHVVSGSGVGGGSLVYFNITERPESSVYQKWPTETIDPNLSIANYYKPAESFIGTNSITTTASDGNFMLLRTKAFQNAAKTIDIDKNNKHVIMNNTKSDGSFDLDARLSITEFEPQILFSKGGPLGLEKKLEEMSEQELAQTFNTFLNKYKKETNVCQRQGRCGLGCIPGARHTLNKQIYKAISDGKPLDVFPLCKVHHIEYTEKNDSDYKYRIILKDYRDLDKGIDEVINAKQVMLSAGTLGSTEILLRSKRYLELSDKLGTSFTTNGDTFGVINRTRINVDASRGPMQTSIAKFKNRESDKFEFSIEDLGVPKMFAEILPIMFNLMALQKKAGSFLPQINLVDLVRQNILPTVNKSNTRKLMSRLLAGLHISPESITDEIAEILRKIGEFDSHEKLREQSLDERVRHIMLLFGIGLDKANGHLKINEKTNEIDLLDKYELDDKKQPIVKSITDMMKLFANQIGQNGEDSLIMPFWDSKNDRQQITAHPLGGCPMGEDATTGVVNSFGQVFRGRSGKNVYENLYVIDGSIIPSPLGVNPSLTISALAFRTSEYITRSQEFWPQ